MLFARMKTYDWKKFNRRELLFHLGALAALAVIAVVAYGYFYKPILHSDDWSVILGRWYANKLNWFNLAEQRPLLMARFKVLYGLFGLDIHAFYLVLWTLNLLNVVLVYFLSQRFFAKNIAVAFSIAAVALVYPSDLTHMWLIMINVRTVVLLILLYVYLLSIYAEDAHWITLWMALLCLLLTFGMYEGQLGIAMVWPLLLLLIKPQRSWSKRLGLLLPLVLGILFILWRTVGYAVFEIEYADHGNEELLQLEPIVILSRLLRGYRLMLWAWLDPLTQAFGLAGWQVAMILLIAVIIFIFLGYVAVQGFFGRKERYLTQEQHSNQLRRFMLAMFIGPVIIGAAYFPSIVFFRPTLFQLHTRLNIFPLIGASVTIVALLGIIASLLSRKQKQINGMVFSGVIPLIFLGTLVQAQVQYDDGVAWEEQKKIWHQLFELVPDFKDDAHIVIILSENRGQIPSLNRNGQRLPFAGGWDIGAGLNMLYGRYDLSGDLATSESFLPEGVIAYYGDVVKPYDQVVVLTYDGDPKQLTIIEDLAAENLAQTPNLDYRPYERITNVPTTRVQFRWLVGSETDKQME